MLRCPSSRLTHTFRSNHRRWLATHKDSPLASTLLSQHMSKQSQGSSQGGTMDNVGPFTLGIQPSMMAGKEQKKWSQLTVGGKIVRTTARASNATVILLGASLTAVLIYALTSELFAKNSPTVLYHEACDRLSASPELSKHLARPLRFHNNPPSTHRPRHRARHVSSQIAVDSKGVEHLLLNFYIESRADNPLTPEYSNSSWFSDLSTNFNELSLHNSKEWVKQRYNEAVASSKRIFLFLSGTPTSGPTALPPAAQRPSTPEQVAEEQSSGWSLGGIFRSLRRATRSDSSSSSAGAVRQKWTEGEVHADLVKDENGSFVFRYILVDIPNSRHRSSHRVFIERTTNVRENEPVFRWD